MEQRPYDAPSTTPGSTGDGTGSWGSGTGSTGFTRGTDSSGDFPSSGTTGERLASEGRQVAARATRRLKDRLDDMTEERKSQATGALEALSRALRSAGGSLCDEGLDPVGKLGMRAAAKVDDAADYLRRSDLDSLLGDVRRVARNHPEILIGGALACGILLGRFLRSSAAGTREVVFEPDFQLERGAARSQSPTRGGDVSLRGDGETASFGGGSDVGQREPRGGWA